MARRRSTSPTARGSSQQSTARGSPCASPCGQTRAQSAPSHLQTPHSSIWRAPDELIYQRRVDEPMPLERRLACKALGDDDHLEVAFAARRHVVPARLVEDLEMLRREGFG
mmetsp:Transcript_21926/g.53881  ORF Transcript_21926/g.53881 Transcript_21926/m.53881 type:complete len:111 (-) Transcript_21926:133-465(-)